MTVILKFNARLLAVLAVLSAPVAMASDPTRPEATLGVDLATQAPTTATVQPKLSMIRSQGTRYQALLDGQWRKTGDKIGVYQIRSISARQVHLAEGERSLVLNLFQITTTTK